MTRRTIHPDGRRLGGERRKQIELRKFFPALSRARLLSARVQQVSMNPELVALAKVLDEELDNLMKEEGESPMKKSWQKYPYIAVWGNHLASFDYYIDGQVELAIETNAPHDAIYRKGDRWVRFSEVADPARFNYLLRKYGLPEVK